MQTLEQYAGAILRGGDGAPRPLWSREALESLARRALATASRPLFADPRHIAIALGLELLPRAPPGLCGEGTARGIVAYAWSADHRDVGVRVGHGIAHALLHRQFDPSTDADAWALTAMLLVPRAAVQTHRVDELVRLARAPEWIVLAGISLASCHDE